MRLLDQILAPLAEGLPRLALPVDAVDVVAEFAGGDGDRVACLLEGFASALQVGRIRLLDEVDHVVELVALEAHSFHPESDLSLP
ncbi:MULTISPECIES: hypothetical protein [Streptomyces]|uniref:Uncharacterized protein n=1 Tax=Streptomyces alboflavus TaxID=67267 RepID=A0A1Z1WK94_9ACTN|nr:hypothetical protein [Streptomyces alboflavus]ARX86863.1 hypothetical protein SMD44_06340 [Streptomyces alboflavus]